MNKIFAVLLCLLMSSIAQSDAIQSYEDEKLYAKIIKDNSKFSYQYYLDNCITCSHKQSILTQLGKFKNDSNIPDMSSYIFNNKISNNIYKHSKTNNDNHSSQTWVTNNIDDGCINIKSEFKNSSNLVGHAYITIVKFIDKNNNILKKIKQRKGVDAKFFGHSRIKTTVSKVCLPDYLLSHIIRVQINHDLPSENKKNYDDGTELY